MIPGFLKGKKIDFRKRDALLLYERGAIADTFAVPWNHPLEVRMGSESSSVIYTVLPGEPTGDSPFLDVIPGGTSGNQIRTANVFAGSPDVIVKLYTPDDVKKQLVYGDPNIAYDHIFALASQSLVNLHRVLDIYHPGKTDSLLTNNHLEIEKRSNDITKALHRYDEIVDDLHILLKQHTLEFESFCEFFSTIRSAREESRSLFLKAEAKEPQKAQASLVWALQHVYNDFSILFRDLQCHQSQGIPALANTRVRVQKKINSAVIIEFDRYKKNAR